MLSLKNKIINGDQILGTMLSEIYTPNILRLLKSTGFEYIFLDCEHGYFDYTDIANIAAVGRGFGIGVIVRVPTVQREFITKVLDIGVDGLLLPQIDNAELAKQAVYYSKYLPLGKRGISTTRSHTEYNPPALAEYIKHANHEQILLAQIESAEAVRNARKILNVDGIDGLIVGPNDMAGDLGIPGQTFSDKIKEHVQQVIKACTDMHKPCGIVDSKTANLHYWQKLGMSIFCIGSELHMLKQAAKENLQAFLTA